MENVVSFESKNEINLDEIQRALNAALNTGLESRRGYFAATPEDVANRISANNQLMLESLENGCECDSLRVHDNGTIEVMFRVAPKAAEGQSRFIDLELHQIHNSIKFVGDGAKAKAIQLIKAVDDAVKAGLYHAHCDTWLKAQAAKFRKDLAA